ncbi:MAG: hypothetical protein V4564_22595 [Pseudomonadota bacterium]|uniref:hypothetical protein n=1 Tax=Sphingomonas sp. ERG5 TaxID=1381597 RepID=UPI00054B27D3|nr:hypothetical protein [Sphingomonas sp. ERG5]
MADPFSSWLRLTSIWADLSRTGLRTMETLAASNSVVERRAGMIDAAIRNPLAGDYAELSRMIPEKVDAFSKSGMAMANEWWSMQAALLTEMQAFWGIALRGRTPTLGEMNAAGSRATSYALSTAERGANLGAVGLAPIHKQATANARRLKRKKSP